MKTNPTMPAPTSPPWDAGGWFGPQIGATLWFFIAAFVLAPEHRQSAAIFLASGLIPNIVGFTLWRQRRRLNPHRALQILVLTIAVFSFLAVRWLDVRGEFGLLDPRVSPRLMYAVLFSMSAMLLALFEAKERAWRKAAAEGRA